MVSIKRTGNVLFPVIKPVLGEGRVEPVNKTKFPSLPIEARIPFGQAANKQSEASSNPIPSWPEHIGKKLDITV